MINNYDMVGVITIIIKIIYNTKKVALIYKNLI